MIDFTSIGNTNCQALPSLSSTVYFEVSSLVMAGAVGQLEPAQPFDVHVAFEARQQQPHRVAVRRAHPLAVLVEADECVVHRLRERNAAAHGGGIGALGDHPFARAGSTPASSSSVESLTPVHSAQASRPWIAGALSGCACGALSAPLLPAHSMKAMRDSIG